MIKKYLRLSQILHRIPISKSTWWQWCKDGKAPQPIKLSVRTTVWLESEIDSFLDSCVSQCKQAPKNSTVLDKPDSAIA